jgi:hypothetical protein
MSTENRDRVRRALREFRKFEGDGAGGTGALPIGDPASGAHNPPKSLLREALEPVALGLDQVTASVSAAAVSAAASASSASASASSASASASSASASAQSATEAEAAKEGAETAAQAAGAAIYDDTTAGLAATVDGDIFLVPGTNTLVVYRNDSGVATELTTFGGFTQSGTGAVATTVDAKLKEPQNVSVEDYGTFAQYVTASSDGGFFSDDATPGISARVRDRLFVGDAARYTGNRFGVNGYGDSWLVTVAPSYLVKNAAFAASCESDVQRIGILGASRTAPGATTSVNIGIAALTLNEGVSTTSRALYTETMHRTSVGGASAGIEVQNGNYTGRTPVVNAYSAANIEVHGVYIAAEGGTGYTAGDSDTLIPPPTVPCGAAIDIAGGVGGFAWQKWVAGFVIRSGALVRDGDNFATAFSLAQKYVIKWEIGSTVTGARLWSEVADPATVVGLKFADRSVHMVGGTNDRTIIEGYDDVIGAGGVNNFRLGNARTGISPFLEARGADTNVGMEIRTKAIGATRFTSHGGSGESLRITPPTTAPTEYINITGSAGLGLATIGTAGAGANIDLRLLPKGSGYLRFGAFTSSGDVAINGYVSIRSDDGTVRKLATIA